MSYEKPYEKMSQDFKSMLDTYISNNKDVSNTKIARKIIKDGASDLSQEYVRKLIEVHKKRTNVNNYEHYYEDFDDLLSDDELELPESLYEEQKPYLISGERKILVINDLHIPYQDTPAIKIALTYAKKKEIDTIILNGDIWDAYSLSSYKRDYDKRDVWTELEMVIKFLSALRKFFPNAEIIYKFGNHEQRYYNFLNEKAPEFMSEPSMKLERKLQLGRFDITHVDDKHFIKAGHLYILHGDEFLGGGAVNVARITRIKANDNVLFGHFHKTQEDIAPTLSDKVVGAWSVGCLCGLRPFYMPINLWTHGFAIVELSTIGDFTVENKKIIRGIVR